MYDVALFYSQISAKHATVLKLLKKDSRPIVLATLHRQENTDDLSRLRSIVKALNELNDEFQVVLPLHPRTQKILERENIRLNFEPLQPLGYFDMIELLKNCAFVITDSGGLQKEAFFFKKQCLVIRDETEWTELVDLGYNHLVGADKNRILGKAEEIKNTHAGFEEKPYGEGNAAEKIALFLKDV
jgi:UDP-GlcNAc3NAcA epimerase